MNAECASPAAMAATPLSYEERRRLAYYEHCSPRELATLRRETLADYRWLMLRYASAPGMAPVPTRSPASVA
ncbi:MAG: hypothetical protein FJ290_21135 [Planctomycetes bacterium]|nr:hypothetical protein [Planctomycetota bacterium]